MKTLKIKPEFYDLIEEGKKTTTIRKETDLKEGDVFLWQIEYSCYPQKQNYAVTDVSKFKHKVDSFAWRFYVNGHRLAVQDLSKSEGFGINGAGKLEKKLVEIYGPYKEFNGVVITFEKKKDPWELLKEDFDIKDLLHLVYGHGSSGCGIGCRDCSDTSSNECRQILSDRYGVEL